MALTPQKNQSRSKAKTAFSKATLKLKSPNDLSAEELTLRESIKQQILEIIDSPCEDNLITDLISEVSSKNSEAGKERIAIEIAGQKYHIDGSTLDGVVMSVVPIIKQAMSKNQGLQGQVEFISVLLTNGTRDVPDVPERLIPYPIDISEKKLIKAIIKSVGKVIGGSSPILRRINTIASFI